MSQQNQTLIDIAHRACVAVNMNDQNTWNRRSGLMGLAHAIVHNGFAPLPQVLDHIVELARRVLRGQRQRLDAPLDAWAIEALRVCVAALDPSVRNVLKHRDGGRQQTVRRPMAGPELMAREDMFWPHFTACWNKPYRQARLTEDDWRYVNEQMMLFFGSDEAGGVSIGCSPAKEHEWTWHFFHGGWEHSKTASNYNQQSWDHIQFALGQYFSLGPRPK